MQLRAIKFFGAVAGTKLLDIKNFRLKI